MQFAKGSETHVCGSMSAQWSDTQLRVGAAGGGITWPVLEQVMVNQEEKEIKGMKDQGNSTWKTIEAKGSLDSLRSGWRNGYMWGRGKR